MNSSKPKPDQQDPKSEEAYVMSDSRISLFSDLLTGHTRHFPRERPPYGAKKGTIGADAHYRESSI
jgi:hypothetical protein